MDALALLLSRLQFAFTASFHIIYHPSPFARGLGLTILEALHLAACRPIVFESGSRFSVWRSILERDQGDRKWYERSSYTLEQTMRHMCSKARLTRSIVPKWSPSISRKRRRRSAYDRHPDPGPQFAIALSGTRRAQKLDRRRYRPYGSLNTGTFCRDEATEAESQSGLPMFGTKFSGRCGNRGYECHAG